MAGFTPERPDYRTPAPLRDGLPIPQRYWAVTAIGLAIALSVLDVSIVNVALPTIAREFAVTSAQSIWIVNAYQLGVLMALLPLASLGEIAGFRRVFRGGLAVFLLASLACVTSPDLVLLAAARFVQGLGAAAIFGSIAALVRLTYPAAWLGRALAINAFVVATCAAAGPALASLILALGTWRWLFGINLPIGGLALILAARVLPDSDRAARALPLASVLLYAGSLGLLLFGLQELAAEAAGGLTALLIGGGAVLAVALVRHELPRPAPVVPFDLLRNRTFTLSVCTSICTFAAQASALISLPFELQRMGYSAVQTGLHMTPWPLALALTAPFSGRLADRYPPGILCATGLGLLSCGLALLAFFPAGGGSAQLHWRMAVCGVGFGLFQAPNNRALISAAPRARSGAAGGMLSASRLLGQTLGAAGVAVLFRTSGPAGPARALAMAAVLAACAAAVSLTRQAPAIRT
ncbi:MAG: MFS transporter [Proteobacteria bacterium]|nr:MFS transporter [Pseudomonadota bacterium]